MKKRRVEKRSSQIDERSRRRDLLVIEIILIGAGILLWFGWHLFWYLTDDAYISFRYISNSMLGYGYVWNTPPFLPVEGYTNFLWMLLLEGVWRLTGIVPPDFVNDITFLFSFATLVLIALMGLRMEWNNSLRRWKNLFIALLLLAIVTNRTFLAWTSSGLETAMFNCLLIAWICCALFLRSNEWRWLLALSSLSTLMALTRPDGLLFILLTLLAASLLIMRENGWRRIQSILSLTPLIIVLIHLVWRKRFYGEWLPNSYYAKSTGIWLESGIQYFFSFVLEYALWFWVGLFVIFLFVRIRRSGSGVRDWINRMRSGDLATLGGTIVLSSLLIHFGYYTFLIGGDHFEYRVYSHLIPLIFLSFLWMLNSLSLKTRTALLLLCCFILLSYAIPWTQWKWSQDKITRKETYKMKVPVAPHWPAFVRPYARAFDALQFWLIDHFVCMRHQEHKMFHLHQLQLVPPRDVGEVISSEGNPVLRELAVGVPAWSLPHVHVIDRWGINDYVIARNPIDRSRERLMAHSRRPPEGYIECFLPNVIIREGKAEVIARTQPLTDQDIIQCEAYWRHEINRLNEETR